MKVGICINADRIGDKSHPGTATQLYTVLLITWNRSSMYCWPWFFVRLYQALHQTGVFVHLCLCLTIPIHFSVNTLCESSWMPLNKGIWIMPKGNPSSP